MSASFEELDFRRTPIGELSLRRRVDPSLGVEVFEIKLGDEFLMSSLFTEGEVALARLGLGVLAGADLDVIVGGLGLGYTARAALEHPGVRSVLVVEALAEVIEWHRRGLVPLGRHLTGDSRCRLVNGDFFALLNSRNLDSGTPGRVVDAILVDIDHSPRNLLHPSHAALYEREGLRRVAGQLRPGGVFALWSNEPPEADFTRRLAGVFATAEAHVVGFPNLAQNRTAKNTVYVARTAAPGA